MQISDHSKSCGKIVVHRLCTDTSMRGKDKGGARYENASGKHEMFVVHRADVPLCRASGIRAVAATWATIHAIKLASGLGHLQPDTQALYSSSRGNNTHGAKYVVCCISVVECEVVVAD